ncbi:unnamed protein product [Boreogadus saida]
MLCQYAAASAPSISPEEVTSLGPGSAQTIGAEPDPLAPEPRPSGGEHLDHLEAGVSAGVRLGAAQTAGLMLGSDLRQDLVCLHSGRFRGVLEQTEAATRL